MSFKYDFMNYAGHTLVSFGAILAYDVFVDGRNVSESLVMKDGLVFAVSTIASSLAYDVISGLLPYINEGSIGGLISRPLLTGAIYMWFYDMMITEKYNGTRDESKTFMVGAGLCLVSGYLQNPIMSLFGMKNY